MCSLSRQTDGRVLISHILCRELPIKSKFGVEIKYFQPEEQPTDLEIPFFQTLISQSDVYERFVFSGGKQHVLSSPSSPIFFL